MKRLVTVVIGLISYNISAQSNLGSDHYTEESVLWICPKDTSVKITYRLSNWENEIEINGPIDLDTSNSITGSLTISEGSFSKPSELSPNEIVQMSMNGNKNNSSEVEIQNIEISLKWPSNTKNIRYYSTKNNSYDGKIINSNPKFHFTGDCKSKKTRELDKLNKLLQPSKEQMKKRVDKAKTIEKNAAPKTKTVVIGGRG